MLKGSLQIYFLWWPVLDINLIESGTNERQVFGWVSEDVS